MAKDATEHQQERAITLSLDPDTRSRLDALARGTNRSPGDLAADAVREYLTRHCDPTLGTDRALPPPKGG